MGGSKSTGRAVFFFSSCVRVSICACVRVKVVGGGVGGGVGGDPEGER